MTHEYLKEVIRLHAEWLRGYQGGKRANLWGANLSGANLSGANLWGANLSGAKCIIRVGPSVDGYEFFAVRRDGVVWIKAGCRWFSADDARAHWSKPRANESLQAQRRAFVEFLIANCQE
jgi:uncharacterized protein YjbI with pentapeptide repeats